MSDNPHRWAVVEAARELGWAMLRRDNFGPEFRAYHEARRASEAWERQEVERLRARVAELEGRS